MRYVAISIVWLSMAGAIFAMAYFCKGKYVDFLGCVWGIAAFLTTMILARGE